MTFPVASGNTRWVYLPYQPRKLSMETICSATGTESDGQLPWDEVIEFQKSTEKIFVYKMSSTASRLVPYSHYGKVH